MSKSMDDFLNLYSKKKTKLSYRRGITVFLRVHYPDLTASKDTDYNALSIQYLSEERDHHADLITFIDACQHYAPTTQRSLTNSLRLWLEENNINLTKSEWRRLGNRAPAPKPIHMDKVLSVDELRELMQHLDVKSRALYLMMVSSGMRIGEVLSLNLKDIDLTSNPAMVIIRSDVAKNGEQRYTFISQEAANALKGWLNVREDYLLSKQRRGEGLNIIPTGLDDPRVFPFKAVTAYHSWNIALKKSSFDAVDSATGWHKTTPHTLRKFFISQLKVSEVPDEIVELLAGHAGYLSNAYRRYSREQVAEFYLKGEPAITIMAPTDYRELKSEMGHRMQQHSELLNEFAIRNARLEKEVAALKRDDALMEEMLKRVLDDDNLIQKLRERL